MLWATKIWWTLSPPCSSEKVGSYQADIGTTNPIIWRECDLFYDLIWIRVRVSFLCALSKLSVHAISLLWLLTRSNIWCNARHKWFQRSSTVKSSEWSTSPRLQSGVGEVPLAGLCRQYVYRAGAAALSVAISLSPEWSGSSRRIGDSSRAELIAERWRSSRRQRSRPACASRQRWCVQQSVWVHRSPGRSRHRRVSSHTNTSHTVIRNVIGNRGWPSEIKK